MKKLLLVLVLAVSVSFAGIDVLLAIANPDTMTTEAIANIVHTDYDSVDFMDVRSTTPDVATLAAYDVVITWSNYTYADPTAMGNNLADYVDGGGKVIVCTFGLNSSSYGLSGRIVDDAAYCPLTSAGFNFVYTDLGSFDPHLIMDGVTTITSLYYTLTCDLESGATWIADLADGYDLAAINATEDVVGLNIYPADNNNWSGDGWVMINNAIRYIGDFVAPEVSGQLPADGATGVAVNSDIVFHVTDDMIGVDTSTISFSVEDGAKAASSNTASLVHTSTSSLVNVEHTSTITGTLVTDDTDPNDVVCTFTPDSNLPPDTITCTIAAGLADDAGNATTADIVWSFDTTGSAIEETTWGQIKTM